MVEVWDDMFGAYSAVAGFGLVIFMFSVILSFAGRALDIFKEEYVIMNTVGFKDAFMANTNRKKLPGSRYVIKCNRGKWVVDGKNEDEVIREAVAVFLPYFNSGDFEGAPETIDVED